MGVQVRFYRGGREESDSLFVFLGGQGGQSMGEDQQDLTRTLRLAAHETYGTHDGVAGREGMVEVHGGTETDLHGPLSVLPPVVLGDSQLQPVRFGVDHAATEGEGGPLDGVGEHHTRRGLIGSWREEGLLLEKNTVPYYQEH